MMKHGWMIGVVVVVVGCGGAGTRQGETLSNTVAMDSEAIETKAPAPGSPEAQEIQRQEALQAARAAGVLGSTNPCGAAANPCGAAAVAPATLDKAGIRAVVQTQLAQITFCYEKRLLVEPTLAGTTTVEFVIAADGAVLSATGSGFDAAVDECVAGVVKTRMKFAASGGDMTTVRYPFAFRTAP